jgi:hypothetical protein
LKIIFQIALKKKEITTDFPVVDEITMAGGGSCNQRIYTLNYFHDFFSQNALKGPVQ